MTTTLKVDWSQRRITAVIAALNRSGNALTLAAAADLDLYLYTDMPDGEVNTLKLDWSAEQITAVCDVLDAAMNLLEAEGLRARDNEPGRRPYMSVVADQAEVHAALREIREYRAAVAEAIKIAFGRNGEN